MLDADGNPSARVGLTMAAERMSIDAFVERAVPPILRLAEELTRAIVLTRGATWQGAPAIIGRKGAG